ncbi:MAG: 23S rRNA (cytidine(2498)-2'-O)-methyltransferase RlmM [Betaproteobacteria bacterium]|nr:23S rRNA (cytidine(2498)-2'-O)-methyltransferase RlmM [Betaproteobacteria bacterium]
MTIVQQVTWLGYCRAGFEPDLAAEFAALAGCTPTSVIAHPASGYAAATFSGRDAKRIRNTLSWSDLVFARQCMMSQPAPTSLPTNDRVTPIVAAAKDFLSAQSVASIGGLLIEYPDTNEGKSLSKLSQTLEGLVGRQLADAGLLATDALNKPRLHVLMTSKQEAWLGLADPRKSSPWRNGIPRLRMPHEAPSRSTLKLAEAFHVFIGDNQERLLRAEMRAVDLGAAPGGWTWQLVHRGLHVTAIDNGPLKGELVDNALVRHLREDGFRYKPKKPVDWMVCDMVEKPVRIAQLVAQWMREGWTERCIFNLKLPMKKRHDEVKRCRAIIEEALESRGRAWQLEIKQLYHDREEVTGFCRFVPRSERGG